MNEPNSAAGSRERPAGHHRSPDHPVFGPGSAALLLSVIAALLIHQPTRAQTTGVESAVVIDMAVDAPAMAADPGIDEIVVTARKRNGVSAPASPFSDPLRERIRRDLAQLDLLIDEYDWRLESALIRKAAPRIRWGYDPRDHLRVAALSPRLALPLDLVQPATVFSVGF